MALTARDNMDADVVNEGGRCIAIVTEALARDQQ
jgi:hypothetical protein